MRPAVWCLLCLAAVAPAHAGDADPAVPRAGMFLVASPGLPDPNFEGSVVLICEHDESGTLGLIINRPTPLSLGDVFPDQDAFQNSPIRLYFGGPVQPGAMLMLVRAVAAPTGARDILDGVYLSGELDTLLEASTGPQAEHAVRVFAGYAGWAPGQLLAELKAGAWVLLPAEADRIFSSDPATLWPDLIEHHRRPTFIRVYRDRLDETLAASPQG